MSKEQQIHDAFDDIDGLLVEGWDIDDAVARAAEDGGLAVEVLKVRLARQFGDLEAHRANLLRAAASRERDRNENRTYQGRLVEVRKAAAEAAETTYFACLLNDPQSAGRPSWPYCIESLVNRLEIDDARLIKAAREAVYATVNRLDREHGTQTAHFK